MQGEAAEPPQPGSGPAKVADEVNCLMFTPSRQGVPDDVVPQVPGQSADPTAGAASLQATVLVAMWAYGSVMGSPGVNCRTRAAASIRSRCIWTSLLPFSSEHRWSWITSWMVRRRLLGVHSD
jgi:hypothetical protein